MKKNVLDALKPNSKLQSLGHGDSFTMFEINVVNESKITLQALDAMGLHNTTKQLKQRLDSDSAKILNGLSRVALQVAKAHVPVKSGYLRNNNIKLSKDYFRSGTRSATLTRTVDITGTHNPPYKHQLESAVDIALMLDTMDWSRSSDGTPTTGWIEEAQTDFKKYKKNYLSNEIF